MTKSDNTVVVPDWKRVRRWDHPCQLWYFETRPVRPERAIQIRCVMEGSGVRAVAAVVSRDAIRFTRGGPKELFVIVRANLLSAMMNEAARHYVEVVR